MCFAMRICWSQVKRWGGERHGVYDGEMAGEAGY